MESDVKILRFRDILKNRRGRFSLDLITVIISLVLTLFFRRVEIVNLRKIPKDGGLVFLMNHPNGLVDAGLPLVALPRKVSFLAKSPLFQMPILGFLARAIEALPVYRHSDAKKDVGKNQETFKACRELLNRGGAIGLFPEGTSHSETKLQPLKTGAARIAIGAVSVGQNPDAVTLKIVPVGLFYTSKTTFRSEAMLVVGDAFPVLPKVLDENGEPTREDVAELNEQIRIALEAVTLNAENISAIENAFLAERLYSSVANPNDAESTLAEKFDFVQKFIADKPTEESGTDKFERRIARYDDKLEILGLEPEQLSLPHYSYFDAALYFVKKSWWMVFAAPLALVGLIVNFPAYWICHLLANLYGREDFTDIASTIKVLSGTVLMPLTWALCSAAIYVFTGSAWTILAFPFLFICGYIAVRTLEEIQELLEWLRAAWLFVSRREKFLKMLRERRALGKKMKDNVRQT